MLFVTYPCGGGGYVKFSRGHEKKRKMKWEAVDIYKLLEKMEEYTRQMTRRGVL
jgi:hypothetical protein